MNERPTPETDACNIERRHIHKRDGSNQLLELIDAEFARKLERERDEARAARNECERQYQEKVAEIAQLLSERDETLSIIRKALGGEK